MVAVLSYPNLQVRRHTVRQPTYNHHQSSAILHPPTTMLLISLIAVLITQGMTIKKDQPQETSASPMKSPRSPKFLNLITWVKFDNTECAATSGDNGTCFTSNECAEIGGTADGSCASGFGVCCVLQVCTGWVVTHWSWDYD